MIVEMRTYTLAPRAVPAYFKIYEEKGLAAQKRVLGHMVGYYAVEVGGLNKIIHLWAYASMEERTKRRAALAADPAWQDYLAATSASGLVQHQENQILTPAPFFTVPPPA